jgi:serine O-acetyltransferase
VSVPEPVPKPRPDITADEYRTFIRDNISRRPGLRHALRWDAVQFAAHRVEGPQPLDSWGQWRTALRMVWVSDDYLGVVLYRLRTWLHDRGVPILPTILHRLCIAFFGIRIGDRAVIGEGVYFPHGNVVIDGVTMIGARCVICPWTTIGVKQGTFFAPQIGDGVFLGTGAKVIGNITIGHGANVGAGSVVIDDVPGGASVAGVPARIIGQPGG